MALAQKNQLIRYFRQLQFLLRNDREASAQFRLLALGLVSCLVLYYAGHTLMIEPKNKKLRNSLSRQAESIAQGSDRQLPELAPKISQLQQKKTATLEEIGVLELREKLQRDQWRSLGEQTRFNNVILTMTPAAPVRMDKNLSQLGLGQKKSLEMFEEQPIMLVGSGAYPEVLAYLNYIENSQEIGSIDQLELKAAPEEGRGKEDLVGFSIQVSKITLKE